MNKILKTEICRVIDVIKALKNHTEFDAYIKELNNAENLSYPEIKYYLEQIQSTIKRYDEQYLWQSEINIVSNAISLLDKNELASIEEKKEYEPINLFWRSFKLWTEQDLPNMDIIKKYYLRYDNWDGGIYFLEINFSSEFTKYCGLEYDDRFDKNHISISDLKLYLEMFYNLFVENRYEYTKQVNSYFQKFKLPYKLRSGKLLKQGYKSTNENPVIINYPMFESKILWSEDRILGNELLDKHTALNYITDGLEYILSLIKSRNTDKKTVDQKSALLFSSDETSKIYSVIKTEVDEIQKIVNEYFDIRHNEYINKAKENRESLNNQIIIEYLYNRINCLVSLLKFGYADKYLTKKMKMSYHFNL